MREIAVQVPSRQDHLTYHPEFEVPTDRLVLALGEWVETVATPSLRLQSASTRGLLNRGLGIEMVRHLLNSWCNRPEVRAEFGSEEVAGLALAAQHMDDRELAGLMRGLAQFRTVLKETTTGVSP